MTTALITGHAGFAGRQLVALLTAEGVHCHGFDLTDGRDIRSYEDVRAAVDLYQPDLLFHLAAQAYVAESVSDPLRTVDVNVLGTVNVLEAVRQLGSHARVLLAGTSEEYGYSHALITEDSPTRPTTPYGASKAGATAFGLAYSWQYGMHVVITRAFNHTGAAQSSTYALPAFARRIADVAAGREPVFTHGNLDAYRDFSDVRDVVRAYRLAIDLEPGIYNVARGRTWTMQAYVNRMIELAGVTVPTKLDEHLHRKAPGNNFTASTKKLHDATGWEPEIDLDTMLTGLLDYWRH
jgi:GDP-4-dehydro-6-deoxy-D-mannose reductase